MITKKNTKWHILLAFFGCFLFYIFTSIVLLKNHQHIKSDQINFKILNRDYPKHRFHFRNAKIDNKIQVTKDLSWVKKKNWKKKKKILISVGQYVQISTVLT